MREILNTLYPKTKSIIVVVLVTLFIVICTFSLIFHPLRGRGCRPLRPLRRTRPGPRGGQSYESTRDWAARPRVSETEKTARVILFRLSYKHRHQLRGPRNSYSALAVIGCTWGSVYSAPSLSPPCKVLARPLHLQRGGAGPGDPARSPAATVLQPQSCRALSCRALSCVDGGVARWPFRCSSAVSHGGSP